MSLICPNCFHKAPEGALFCDECGSELIAQGGVSTTAVPVPHINRANSSSLSPEITTAEPALSLHVVRTGQILPLVGRQEFTIGRVSEGQSILPDVDLTPYEAYKQGVSRLHATIKIESSEISIVDLGSSNGTQVNSVKIGSHKEFPLNHGDIISLGQFKIQALVRQD